MNETNHKTSLSPNLEQRIFAFAIDTFLFSCLNILVIMSFAFFAEQIFSDIGLKAAPQLFKSNLQLFYIFSTPLVFLSYFTFSMYLMNGKTIGKMINHSQVVTDGGEEHIPLKVCVLRSCGYLFGFLSFGLFFLPNFFREDHLGLADMLSNSSTKLKRSEVATQPGQLILLNTNRDAFSSEDDETKAA